MTINNSEIINPYPGRNPYATRDKKYFLGRDKESYDLTTLIRARRLILFFGDSGAGKTSLINAGVIPMIEKKEFGGYKCAVIRLLLQYSEKDFGIVFTTALGTDLLLRNLPEYQSLTIDQEEDKRLEISQSKRVKEFTDSNIEKSIEKWSNYTEKDGSKPFSKIVIFIDQFEEFFKYSATEKARSDFLTQLYRVQANLNLRVRIVISIHSVYIAHFEYPIYIEAIPSIFANRYSLSPLYSEQAIKPIIESFYLYITKTEDKTRLKVCLLDDNGNLIYYHEFDYKINAFILKRIENSVGKDLNENLTLINDFGKGLYDAIFDFEIKRRLEALKYDTRLILLFAKDDHELLRVPWEFLFDGTSFLAAMPKITFLRSIADIPKPVKDLISGKIKILAIISSPLNLTNRERLNIEQEKMQILQSLDRAIATGRIEIEFEDEATLTNIQSRLDEMKPHIIHYTGHGSYEDGVGYLILEDDDGRARPVDNNTVATLFSGYPSIRLIFLSGCQTAKTSGREAFTDVTTPLIKGGVPAVISMQYSVSDTTAISLAVKFYRDICNGEPIDTALTNARRQILLNEGAHHVDFATPVLYTTNPDSLKIDFKDKPIWGDIKLPDISTNISVDLTNLGNEFIGRRKELRRIKDDFFRRNIRSVIIHGIGGIGKTVTASQCAIRLKKYFTGILSFKCTSGFNVEELLIKINDYLIRNKVDVFDQICTAPIPIGQKISYLSQILIQIKLLLIFDNFEDVLDSDNKFKTIKDPVLRDAFQTLINQCSDGTKFLFTSRYTFDLTDGRLTNVLDEINFGEMSEPEAFMLFNKFPEIAVEDFYTKREIYRKIGGQPYVINIFGRHTKNRSVAEILKDLSVVNKEMAVFILLERSYNSLTGAGRTLLDRISIFEKPVVLECLQWMVDKDNVLDEIDELVHWGMITKIDIERTARFQCHTIVRDFMRERTEEGDIKQWLVKGGEFYEDLYEKDNDIGDYLEARHLHFRAGEYDRAGEIVANTGEILHRWGFIELVKRLNLETIDTASVQVKANAWHHLGIIHQDQGEYALALEMFEKSLEINNELGDKAGISKSLHQIGIIHQLQGEYALAFEMFEKSLEIDKELGDKSGISKSLHQIGRIHQNQGEYALAFEMFEKSLEINNELGDKAGISKSLHQIGRIHQDQGEYALALEMFEKSLEINKELGDKSGIAYSLHQIGRIHQDQGEYALALEMFEKSLEIKKELGDKAGIASSIGQIGRILEEKEDYKGAMKNYQTALSIFTELKSPDQEIAKQLLSQLSSKIGEDRFNEYLAEITQEMGQ